MAKTMELMTTAVAITAAIKSIKGRGARLDRDIQIAAVSIIQHVEAVTETSLATQLIEAMPKGARTNALRNYFEAFGKMVWAPAKGDLTAKFIPAADKVTDMDGAMAVMWTEFKPEPTYTPIDIQKTLTTLLKRINKASADGKQEFDAAQVAALEAAITTVTPAEEEVTGEEADATA